MHHGYYVPENHTDHIQAQIDLIDKVLEWSTINSTTIEKVADVGCGIGGSSRHLANKVQLFLSRYYLVTLSSPTWQ
jgi:ubiquinone/menaquinone biosynthesis C-methylase UbiE